MDVVIEDHVRLLNNIIHFSTPNDKGCASPQPATVTVAEGVVLETTIDPLTKRHLLTCDICKRIIQLTKSANPNEFFEHRNQNLINMVTAFLPCLPRTFRLFLSLCSPLSHQYHRLQS